MSPRSRTAGPGRPPRSTATTELSPVPVRTSRPRQRDRVQHQLLGGGQVQTDLRGAVQGTAQLDERRELRGGIGPQGGEGLRGEWHGSSLPDSHDGQGAGPGARALTAPPRLGVAGSPLPAGSREPSGACAA